MLQLREIDFSPLGTGPWRAPARPPISVLPHQCDCVVIGGGVTGWSSALSLTAYGADVVLLDRGFGQGSACRSGGIVVGDTVVGPAPDFDRCEFDLRAWTETYAPDLPFEWSGVLELERNALLPAAPIDWYDAGVVRASGTVPGGTVDPAALLGRLAAEAVRRGTRFVDGFHVETLDAHDGRAIVEGGGGRIKASRVLVATDATATAAGFAPWPVRQFTVALETTPLAVDQIAQLGWSRQPFYTNGLPLLWGRVLPGGGMLAGRELIPATGLDAGKLEQAIAAAGDRLFARVRGLHPALRGIDRARVWAGPIARDERGIPAVHADPDVPCVIWAGGYGGHGLAQAFRLGAIAAARMIAYWSGSPT